MGRLRLTGLLQGCMVGLFTVLITNCERPAGIQVEYGLVIHGGAGTITREKMTPEREAAYRERLTAALEAGYAVLSDGGTALDAVEAAIIPMEDSPLFNAGKGAVFNTEGMNELDASIMDGRTLAAGAVAGVHQIKNPIRLARLVMEESPHVLMSGEGAEIFGSEFGIETVTPDYYFTQRRWDAMQRAKEKEAQAKEHGTVGAAALDQHGNLAAGTSTGGITNKKFGRIGDSPIIGAGTYADNRTCAVSCTGDGEYFIRIAVAHDISALMAYRHLSLQAATELVVLDKLVEIGGDGGVIGIDHQGHIAMTFNTAGMYRGYVDQDGQVTVEIFKN